MVLGPVDELRHDEEVRGEAHRLDDVEFLLEPGVVGREIRVLDLLQADLQPPAAVPLEVAVEAARSRRARGDLSPGHEVAQGEVPGRREGLEEEGPVRLGVRALLGVRWGARREEVGPVGEVEVAALGELDGPVQRVAVVREELAHLGFALEVELIRAGSAPVLVVQARAQTDALEQLQAGGVRGGQVVHVVGDHRGEPELPAQVPGRLVEGLLVGQAGVLELQVEPVGPQAVPESLDPGAGLFGVGLDQGGAHRPAQAAGEEDQAVPVGLEPLQVHPRLVVHAVEDGVGDQLAEVLVALAVLDQGDQVVAPVAPTRVAVGHALGLHPETGPDDRVDAGGLAGLVEGDGPVEVAVVGERHRGLAQRGGAAGELLDRDGPVEQRELAVDVEVDEGQRRVLPALSALSGLTRP